MTKQEEETFKGLIIEAVASKETKNILTSIVVDVIQDTLMPTLEDMWDDIRQLKTEIRHMKERNDIRFQRLERKAGVTSI